MLCASGGKGATAPLPPVWGASRPQAPASAIRFSSEQCSEEKRIAPVASDNPATVILAEKKTVSVLKKCVYEQAQGFLFIYNTR